MSSCLKCQKRSKCHLNGVEIAVVFRKKIAKIALWLGALPQAPIVVTCSLAHNLHNQRLSKSLSVVFE